jgi:predicted Zn-dependent peptidase
MFGASYAPGQPPVPQSGPGFAQRVSEITMPNGLRLVVLERHEAPTISFHTYVRAGSANVPAGQTGLLKLLEKLAWSGTESAEEKKALDAVEEAYDRVQAERNKGAKADEVRITSLGFDLQRAIDRANSLAKPGEYLDTLTNQGATGVGVAVSADAIRYSCTLPSNRAAFWFSIESQRLVRAVVGRRFYAERDNLVEQVRRRSAETRAADELVQAAFVAHPYRNPTYGWAGDLESLRPADLRNFIDRYFVPANIVIAIAGDITPAEAKQLADKYFAGAQWSARPAPAPIPTVDPAQSTPRTALSYSNTSPMVAIGYRRPDQLHRDDAIFDAIQGILGGTEGWLDQDLQKSAVAVAARLQGTYPGGRYPGLFAILVQPAAGRSIDQTVAAVQAVLDRLRNQPVDEATLARARGYVRSAVLTSLMQNSTAATLLAASVAEYGDAQEPMTELERMEKLTAADVQRVAAKYFLPEHRTVAYSGPEMAPAAGAQK